MIHLSTPWALTKSHMIYVNLNIIFYTHVEKSLCVKDILCMLPWGHFFFFFLFLGGWGGGWGSHPKDYYQHQQAEQNQSSLRPDLGGWGDWTDDGSDGMCPPIPVLRPCRLEVHLLPIWYAQLENTLHNDKQHITIRFYIQLSKWRRNTKW